MDSIAARGGLVSDDDAVSGNGGNGSRHRDERSGGSSGNIGNNGSGGNGGTITITGGAGDMAATAFSWSPAARFTICRLVQGPAVMRERSATAATAERSATTETEVIGGDITISSTSGTVGLSLLIAAGGDVDGTFKPQTGNGGKGGKNEGGGGSSGEHRQQWQRRKRR